MRNMCHIGQKPNAETIASWIMFPDGVEYLLAKYTSKINMIPKIVNGELTLETTYNLPEVAEAVENFLGNMDEPVIKNNSEPLLVLSKKGGQMYLYFLKAIKAMLGVCYDWDNAKYEEVLKFDVKQYGKFLPIILHHILYT